MEEYKINHYSCEISSVDIKEVYRYMGGMSEDNRLDDVIEKQTEIIISQALPKAVYMITPVSCVYDEVDFGLFAYKSSALAVNLQGCSQAVIFGATIGHAVDREIMKYVCVSPVKALISQAVGTVLIEKTCNNLCDYISKCYGLNLKPRFSPGYADLELIGQKELFNVLNLEKNCGITLTDSYIMRPSKSVTAIAGISEFKTAVCNKDTKCLNCENKNCMYKIDM